MIASILALVVLREVAIPPSLPVSVDPTCRCIDPWIARDGSATTGGDGGGAVAPPVPRCHTYLRRCRLFGMEDGCIY